MARNRQRAKQRQAERRAARLGEGRTAPSEVAPSAADRDPGTADGPPAPIEAQLAAAAPPETAGRSDTVVESPPPPPDAGTDGHVYDDELEEDDLGADEAALTAGSSEPGEERERAKVLAFLAAVVAELKRVQWPNRSQLTSLTGIVLGFVLIAGGYLGLLDAIVSRLIQAVL